MNADEKLASRMREDWDRRAEQDAFYYVSCVGGNASDQTFQAAAEYALSRIKQDADLIDGSPRPLGTNRLRVAEIGCGPGHLALGLAPYCREYTGFDISPAMVDLARKRAAKFRQLRFEVTSGDLHQLGDRSVDLVVCWFVFQHIPSRQAVFRYLREAYRVVRPGGLLSVQFNCQKDRYADLDTWAGIYISEEELTTECRSIGWRLLRSEGLGTAYLWWGLQKPVEFRCRILSIGAPEPNVLIAGGPNGFATIWVAGLAWREADAFRLTVKVGADICQVVYVGTETADGARQINFYVGADVNVGAQKVALMFDSRVISACSSVEVLASTAIQRKLTAALDGADHSMADKASAGDFFITFTSPDWPAGVEAVIAGVAYTGERTVCLDPAAGLYRTEFHLPSEVTRDNAVVDFQISQEFLGRRNMHIGQR